MSAFYDLASLVVVPSGYKTSKVYAQKPLTTDGQLAFTRSTTATRVGPDGLIEKVRTNLLPYSQDFSTAAWAAEGTMSETFSQTDPNGGTTAVLVSSGTSGNGYYYHNITCVANVPNTFSIYIKGNASGSVSIRIDDSTTAPQFDINYTTSWQRFSVTRTPDQTGCTFVVGGFSTWDIGENLSFAFAQHETGDIATDYIATTSAAVSVGPLANVPRLDYLGSSCPRLILEPQRTNAITFSEAFDNAAYTKGTNVAVTSNTATSPSGYQDADTLANSGSSSVFLFQYVVSLTAQTVTASVFAKKNTNKYLGISLTGDNSSSSRYQAIFDLETGAFAQAKNSTTPLTGQSYKIENYGNGWYRCSVTATFAISAKPFVVLQNSNILSTNFSSSTLDWSDATIGSIYIFGMQAEGASYGTSYIPTLGAAVTRGADAASKTGISSLIGQTEGTIYWEGKVGSNNSEVYVFLQNTLGSGITDSIFIQRASGVGVAFNIYDSTTQVVNISGGTYTIGQTLKIAAAYKLNDVVLYVNGVQIGTDTSAAIPATTSMQLGVYPALPTTELYMSDNVKQTLLFPTRLSNSDLAALTA
jgi:hypothetical protein